MDRILGAPKYTCQGIPNLFNVRLAFMENWNERLTKARLARGLNKSELARGVGVSNPTVTDWESGEIKKLEAENLLKICELLCISTRWLMLGRGEMDEIVLTENDLHAIQINRALGVKERQAWYRAGIRLLNQPKGQTAINNVIQIKIKRSF